MAVKATDWLSLGVSLNIEYARATLRNALPNPTTPGGPTAPGDGRATVKGDDTSVGFTLGVLTQPFERARLGVAWRWGISHELDGTLDVTGLKGILKVANEHVGRHGRSRPAAGGHDRRPLRADATACACSGRSTGTGGAASRRSASSPPAARRRPSSRRTSRTRSASRAASSGRSCDGLRVRGGFQYDQTPTRDGFRNSRIPDADRYLLGAGLTYDLTDQISATFGYMHAFVKEATFDRARTIYGGTPLATRYRFVADASAMVNIVGAGFTYRF